MNNLIFMYTAKFSVLVPFIDYFFLKHKNNRNIKAVFMLVSLSVVTEIINEVYIRTGHRGTLILNIFYVLQLLMVSYIYRFHLLAGKYSRLINTLTILFLAWFIGVTAFVEKQHIHAPQNWVWTVSGIIIVTYGIVHYFYLRKTVERVPPIYTQGELWVTIAFLSYFTYSIGLFFLSNHIFSEKMDARTAMTIWNFHNFYYIIKNLLLTYAMYRISKEQERVRFPFEKYGETRNWRRKMKPNSNLDKQD